MLRIVHLEIFVLHWLLATCHPVEIDRKSSSSLFPANIVTVCYPDGNKCLPGELCKWKNPLSSLDKQYCRCIENRNCEAPYRKKGRHAPVKASCKFIKNRLQCFCYKGYVWSNSGRCVRSKTHSGETKNKGGLPGSVLFALAMLVMLAAAGGAAYCFIKRRRDGPEVTVTPPSKTPSKTETIASASAPVTDDEGDAETALLAEMDTKKLLKPNKSRSRLSLTKGKGKDKDKKSKDAKKSRSHSASGESSKTGKK